MSSYAGQVNGASLLHEPLGEGGGSRNHYTVDFSGYVTFKAAHDLLLGLALGATTRNIAAGALVYSHAHDAYQVQSAVSVAVTVPVEAVSYDLTRGRLYGRDPAQTGEGGFAPEPLGVVSDCQQERGCVVSTDCWKGDKLGSRLYIIQIFAGTQAGGYGDELLRSELAQALTELLWRRNQKALKLVGDLASGLHRRAAGRSQDPKNHLYATISAFGLSGCLAGQYRPGGSLGVSRVRLAVATPVAAFWSLYLHHLDPHNSKVTSESGPIAAGSLHPAHLTAPKPSAQARRSS